jgi:hypothetical protein
MERLDKRTGGQVSLDPNKHLRVKQVAGMLEIDPVVVWKAMRLGRLKYIMAMTVARRHPLQSGFIRVTTQAWVDEWRATINDKNFQTYNGKQMYDRRKGEMSSRDVRDLFGWTKNRFMYYVLKGDLKYIRRGYYYVFNKTDVEEFYKKIQEAEEAIG